jgi:hypothetical protein
MLTRTELTDCLNLLASISFRKIEVTDLMLSIYADKLDVLSQDALIKAVQHFYDQRIFPTPQEILEFLGEITPIDTDWYKIVGVARESLKSDTISGISLAALQKITSANGMRSALMAIARADDNQLNRYRTDWQREHRKADKSGLPPSNEIITLEIPASQKDVEYPVDTDYSVRTASLIRLLNKREIKTSTAIAMCSRFPECKKSEVMAIVDAIEEPFKSPSAEIDKVNELVMGIL